MMMFALNQTQATPYRTKVRVQLYSNHVRNGTMHRLLGYRSMHWRQKHQARVCNFQPAAHT